MLSCGKANPCYHLTPFCPNCGDAMQKTTGMTPIELEILRADLPETTQTETQNSNLTFEKQTDCSWK